MSSIHDVFDQIDRMPIREGMSEQEARDFRGLVQPDDQLSHAMRIADIGQRIRGDKAATLPMDGKGNNYGSNITLVNSFLGIGNVPTAASNGQLPKQDVLNINGDDSESMEHIITLSAPNFVHAGSINQVLMPVARLIYGSGGVQSQCDVDWGQGGSFALPGSFIRIQAYLFPFFTATNIWTEFADPAQIRIGAFISKNNRSRNSKLVRSLRDQGQGIPHGANIVFPIPPCATSVRMFWAPSTVTKVNVKFETQDAITIYQVDLTNDADFDIPLAGALGEGSNNAFGNQENSILLVTNQDGAVDITSIWAIFTIEP